MDNKSSFMGGLFLKPAPKIVTKNDNKTINRQSKVDPRNSNKNLNTLNNNLKLNHQSNSFLNGNSLNLNTKQNQPNNSSNNKIQFIRHAENILRQAQRPSHKSISLLQKNTPVKMQSLLQKRSILNTMNSNLIANHHNSNNLLINSLMKTTMSTNLNAIKQEKIASCSNDNKVDDKMIKVIKLCVTKLEFSSPLFRRIATKMTFLYVKPTYEHVRNYERFCSTSNKTVLKQVMNKGHTLKYKPSKGRIRMLRSNEIVDGKVMISWQRDAHVHVYTFNRRQRLRRYRQISMDLGFEHRTLQIMYGLKKVTIPKIIQCPFCNLMLTPDLGHNCIVVRKTTKRLRTSKNTSLLKQANKKIKHLNDSIQTSDYVSNESDTSTDLSVGLNHFRPTRQASLLDDSSKINLFKMNSDDSDKLTAKRCPTLLLDSSNYKTNQNSISNVIVKRLDNKEMHKRSSNTLLQSPSKQNEANLDKLRIRKVNQPVNSLIKCSVMDQHNFDVSMENNIKIVFK